MRTVGNIYKELVVLLNLDRFIIFRNNNQWPLEDSWYSDYEVKLNDNLFIIRNTIYQVLSCPAVKFTDRFLIHGEFFIDESPAK